MGKIIRILFIENQLSDADLAMKEIAKELAACEFRRVETELEFLEAVKKYEPDLVLSDYWLPHFSGMRALELLQEIAPLTPLIIYTESKNEDIAVECMKAGAVNYIIKGNLKRLGTAVIHALSEKKMQIEQKKAEEKLLDSESKLRKAQHFAHMGSWTWNIKTNHLDWSDEMYNIFGLEKETFSGDLAEVIAQAIHPEDRAAVEQSNLSVITQGKPVPLEYRIIWNDGSVHVVWGEAGEIVFDETGAPRLLSGTVQEITERKRNEEILQKSEASFRSIFEKTATGYVLTALDGRLLKVNAAMADMLGYRMDALQEVNFQDITHPDDISISAESVRSLLAGKKIHVNLRSDTCIGIPRLSGHL
ncbi:MAG: PAS domain S-box protein [Anaerolineales bacterium]|nr:PAS domain S-box protein [Anaerolineales bacterium]